MYINQTTDLKSAHTCTYTKGGCHLARGVGYAHKSTLVCEKTTSACVRAHTHGGKHMVCVCCLLQRHTLPRYTLHRGIGSIQELW